MLFRDRSFALILGALVVGLGVGYLLAPRQAAVREGASRVQLDSGQVPTPASRGSATGTMELSSEEAGRDLAEAESTRTPHVPSALLAKAKAGLDEAQPQAGHGTITGTVRDLEGTPLEGVTVVATSCSSARILDSSAIGTGPPGSATLDGVLEEAAASWSKSRARQVQTKTGADGSYAFEALASGEYDLQGYQEDWVIRSEGSSLVGPGSLLDFTATPVASLKLDVRMPDGSPAPAAVVEAKSDDEVTRIRWSPDAPTVRFGTPRFALTVFSADLGQNQQENKLASRFKSTLQWIDLDERAPGPLVVQLEGRPGIHGTIQRAWPSAHSFSVVAVKIPDNASFDPHNPPEGGHVVSVRSDSFSILDLEPGLYATGILTEGMHSSESIKAVQFVELDTDLVEVQLDVPAPSLKDYVVLHCLDPTGRDIRNIKFDVKRERGGTGQSGHEEPIKGPDGGYWFPVIVLGNYDFDHWPPDCEVVVTAKSPRYGNKTESLRSGVHEYTLHFEPAHSLTVHIAGYSQRDPGLQPSVLVLAPGSKTGWGNTVLRTLDRRGWGDGPRLSPAGSVTFPKVAPGHWVVQLVGEFTWPVRVLDTRDLELTSSDVEVTLTLPPLYDLDVHAPTVAEEQEIWLASLDESTGKFTVIEDEYVPEDHRLHFHGLLAGTYKLSSTDSDETLEITIPTDEVLFEPRRPSLLSVSIFDKSGALKQAGLHHGDRIAAVDGQPVDEFLLDSSISERLKQGPVKLTVSREGQTLTIMLEAGASDLGGRIMPLVE